MRWLALGAVALPLTACGTSSSTSTPVAQAADKAVATGSEHVTFDGTVVVPGSPDTRVRGAGDFQTSPSVGSAHLTVAGGGHRLALDEVLEGARLYMKSPLFRKAMGRGKSWLYLDLKQASKLGINFSAFTQANPADTLQALGKVRMVTKIGDETIDGTRATHYRATVASKAVTEPVDVWVGSGNVLRRMRFAYATNASGSSLSGTMTMDFSNYGEQVSVTPPSADETLDMTKLGG
jgi:hypothetical protein